MKIGYVLTTPKCVGGTETALKHSIDALASCGHEVDFLALNVSKTTYWQKFAQETVTRVLPKKQIEALAILDEYDGLILSNILFEDKYLPGLMQNTTAKWTSGIHTNAPLADSLEFHASLKDTAWTGKYVHFWESSRDSLSDAEWVQTTLPYQVNDELSALPPADTRNTDFLFMGRADHRKGVVAFINGLHGVHVSGREFTAEIAGAPDSLGGLHTRAAREHLISLGWDVTPIGQGKIWTATRRDSTIAYSGEYRVDQVPEILATGKIFVNLTSGWASNGHLEYSTLEALNAGCLVMARKDYPEGAYPGLFMWDLPEHSYRIRKGRNHRQILNDGAADAWATTYAELSTRMAQALDCVREGDSDYHVRAHKANISAIDKTHDPRRTIDAYLTALDMR